MMAESDSNNSPLLEGEIDFLNQARALKPTSPPEPWGSRLIIPAAGVLAAGWDRFESLLLISSDGYSLTDVSSGDRVMRNRNREATYAAISSDYSQFNLLGTPEIIHIFGVWGGDGIHKTQDGWTLKAIYPWWPRESVILKKPVVPGSGQHGLLDDAYLIELQRLTGWLKWGFSPSGKYFAIIGSAGAEIFSR